MASPHIDFFSRLSPQNSTLCLQSFADGLLLSQLLTGLSNFPAPSLHQHASTFAHIFTNLKQLYAKIEEYWNKQFDKELQCEEIDLVEIAHHGSEGEIEKLFNLVVQTVILSPEREYFVGKILETQPQTQEYFMEIVERTMEKRRTFSPRKQKQQRLYDKMVELDHENENLQNVIVQICKEKQEMEQQWRKVQEIIAGKDAEIQKLNQKLGEFTQTPYKKRQSDSFDTNEKNCYLVERLKQKIIDMNKNYEKQTLGMKQQIQYLSQRAQLASHLQNEIQMYRVKIEDSKQAMDQYGDLSRKYAQIKLHLIQKQEAINEYCRKLTSKTTKLQQLQQKLVQRQLQLQRKNIQIQQLSTRTPQTFTLDDPFSSISSVSLQRSLSQHCPQVANSQAQFLYDSNKRLRQQLQRASTTIKQRQSQLQKMRRQYEQGLGYEAENRKLVEIVERMSDRHEEEKLLLLGCMHELRVRVLDELAPRERAHKQEMLVGLREGKEGKLLTRNTVRRVQI